MKKIKDLLLSVILPRRMYHYHDMKVIYSVLVFILSAFLLLFSINLSTEKFMKQIIEKPDFDNYTYQLISEESDKIPNYKIATSHSGNLYLDCETPGEGGSVDTFRGVYNLTLKDESRGSYLLVTIVFYEDLDLFSSNDTTISENSVQKLKDNTGFDLAGYMSQPRKDNTNYMLYVYTMKSLYYLYNLGQEYSNGKWVTSSSMRTSSFEYNATDGTTKYFVPKDESELVLNSYGKYDTSNWTIETTEDGVASFDSSIKAEKRIANDIRKVISSGEYVYGNLETDLINGNDNPINFSTNSNIPEVIKLNVDLMADSDATIQKNMYSFFVVLLNVIFPVIWVFITWLLSKRFAMNKFREYYAICSITYITTSFIGFILGFFISFDRLMLILLIIELLYYIFVTFRINTDPSLLEENNDENDSDDKPIAPKIVKPNVEFKKVQSDDAYRVE